MQCVLTQMERINKMIKPPLIEAVEAVNPMRLCITWSTGESFEVDLSEPVMRLHTLARLRDTSSFEVAEYLSARAAFGSPPFSVSRFVLFSSRASTGGGPYVAEAIYPLAA